MKEERRRTKEISELKSEIEEEEGRRKERRRKSQERRGTRELKEETRGERRGTREIQEEVAMALALRGGMMREEKKERRMSREMVDMVVSKSERRVRVCTCTSVLSNNEKE